ncbi:hypothetical protein KAJ89_02715 [Candidatus Parcubacteria bacterium]|nr:hypothetical protein [Candidatus Parcubacteria bacterium]
MDEIFNRLNGLVEAKRIENIPINKEGVLVLFERAKRAYENAYKNHKEYEKAGQDKYAENVFLGYYDAIRLICLLTICNFGYKPKSAMGHQYSMIFGKELLASYYETEEKDEETRDEINAIFDEFDRIVQQRNSLQYDMVDFDISWTTMDSLQRGILKIIEYTPKLLDNQNL